MREQNVISAEQNRDAGFADERTKLNTELRDKKQAMECDINTVRETKLSELEEEIAKIKNKRLEDISKAEQTERERIRTEMTKERLVWDQEKEDARKRLANEWKEVEIQKHAVSAQQSELEGQKTELELNERILERRKELFERQCNKKNEEFDDLIEERLDEKRASMETQIQSYKEHNARLNESLKIQTDLIGAYEQMERQLGGENPVEIIRQINSMSDELRRLQEELATRPTEEMRERYQSLQAEADRYKTRVAVLENQISVNNSLVAESNNLRRMNSELEAEKKSLAQTASIYERDAKTAEEKCDSLRIELKRLLTPNERPEEEQKRYKEIEKERIKADEAKVPKDPGLKKPKKTDYPDDDAYNIEKEAYYKNVIIHEINWLTKIGDECDKIGLHFNQRILKAFHTALKTADWSLLTILAGVSGTGKSELPRLYSHFGGIYFEELSVQPNWDSKESMLGFFNSIDNKFAAEPVLHFLAQSQMEWEEKTENNKCYPGLIDAVCLILLDEMNLAHPELYFAEFLSKLEKRRGLKGKEKMPDLPVSIGAGMTPYPLKLGRNVLWTGTMNQDETTKSLSDKILDRSIIIHFPRPTELKRRDEIIPLTNDNRGTILHRKSWESWLTRKSPFSDKDIKPYKDFIEEMNESLSVVGRAIGHRVWQSIEYYIANYPDVRDAMFTTSNDADKEKLTAAMHTAFEDQLAQKVMPKLRGIDTRERSKSKTECLDKILSQLNAGVGGNRFNLADDFNIACGDLGHGQFIWQSANYLNYDPAVSSDGSKNDVD